MPRQIRIEIAGATYHVMCRGDRREDIFFDDGDREMMLATLAETVGKMGWLLHAWVWMSNHYHLLVETPEPNLVKGMAWFQTTYTARFNARHRVRGHLFGVAWGQATFRNILLRMLCLDKRHTESPCWRHDFVW